MPTCDVSGCRDDAIIEHRETCQKRCLTHAVEAACGECDHTQAQCPIIGCGVWRAVSAMAGSLLLFEVTEKDKLTH
jgi:hypothetical protein